MNLAELVSPRNLAIGDTISFIKDGNDQLIILIKGALKSESGTEAEKEFNRKVIISPGMNVDKKCKSLTATKKSTILTIDRHKYFNMLADNTGILQEIFEVIQK